MRFIVILSLLSSVFSETYLRGLNNDSYHWNEFTNFKKRFDKRYTNMQELETRFSIFKKNFINIISHNLDTTQNYTMSVNQFTDLTPEEFKAQHIGGLKNYGLYGCKKFASTATNTPSSVDWRTKGAVTSVKDQGQCGSCWSFSSTGVVEGAWAISKGQLINLSEQELVDCATGFSYGSHGCNGGQMEGAFKYVIENGQCSWSSYAYTSGETKKSEECKSCTPVAYVTTCSEVNPNDHLSLKAAISMQPVAVAIEADTRYFQSYSSGVLTSTSCGTNLDHGVLAVGYGTENGQDYYLVKNSWGTTWGDNGYVKIARSSSTNDPGICGIAMQASFATV